ncbi:MAG: ABC transporter permease [Acetobacteraceae bacterium]
MAAPVGQTVLFDSAVPEARARALSDLLEGLAQWRLALRLALLDLRNRYRGSVLGPLWMTLSVAVMVAGLGLLYSALFKLEVARYLPHLAVSLVVWNWLSGSLNDACQTFIGAEGIIRQIRLPYTVHVLRCLFRNMLTAAHSVPVVVVVFLIFGIAPGPEILLVPIGLAIIAVNIVAAGFLLGMVCARFRDVPQIVGNLVQFGFFLTPVLWKAELLGEDAVWMLLNPFYPLLETVRGPLVEGGGPLGAWIAALVYTAIGCGLAAALFVRLRNRIAFWV